MPSLSLCARSQHFNLAANCNSFAILLFLPIPTLPSCIMCLLNYPNRGFFFKKNMFALGSSRELFLDQQETLIATCFRGFVKFSACVNRKSHPTGQKPDDMWKALLTICPWKCVSTEVNPSWDKSHLCVCLLSKVYPTSLSFGISKGNSCTVARPLREKPPLMIMFNANLFPFSMTGTLNQIFLILLLFAF